MVVKTRRKCSNPRIKPGRKTITRGNKTRRKYKKHNTRKIYTTKKGGVRRKITGGMNNEDIIKILSGEKSISISHADNLVLDYINNYFTLIGLREIEKSYTGENVPWISESWLGSMDGAIVNDPYVPYDPYGNTYDITKQFDFYSESLKKKSGSNVQ